MKEESKTLRNGASAAKGKREREGEREGEKGCGGEKLGKVKQEKSPGAIEEITYLYRLHYEDEGAHNHLQTKEESIANTVGARTEQNVKDQHKFRFREQYTNKYPARMVLSIHKTITCLSRTTAIRIALILRIAPIRTHKIVQGR